MFGLGAKSNVPNTSQYDFGATKVILKLINPIDETTTKFL